MKRREFITLLSGAAVAWPLPARAQQRMPVIGFLGTASAQAYAERIAAISQGLKDKGFIAGANLKVEYRWADGHFDRLHMLAADLVERKVDLIIATGGSPAPLAANINVLPEMRDVQALASALSIEVATLELRQPSDIAPAVEGLKDRADALYVVTDPFVINNRIRINTLALAARLPTIHGFREGAEASGFVS